MGLVLGMLGGGGGILTVPILVGFFGLAAKEATGASLLVVGSVSLIGAGQGLIRGTADLRAAITLGVPASLGAFVSRSLLVPAIPDQIAGIASDRWLLGAFALLMFIVAWRMVAPKSDTEPETKSLPFIAVTGFAVGVLSGTLGAGGGFLILPALTLLLGLEMKRAVATSLVVITIQSLVGFSGELANPQPWPLLGGMIAVAAVGLAFGLLVRDRVPKEKLQISFAVLIVAVGLWMLVRVL